MALGLQELPHSRINRPPAGSSYIRADEMFFLNPQTTLPKKESARGREPSLYKTASVNLDPPNLIISKKICNPLLSISIIQGLPKWQPILLHLSTILLANYFLCMPLICLILSRPSLRALLGSFSTRTLLNKCACFRSGGVCFLAPFSPKRESSHPIRYLVLFHQRSNQEFEGIC